MISLKSGVLTGRTNFSGGGIVSVENKKCQLSIRNRARAAQPVIAAGISKDAGWEHTRLPISVASDQLRERERLKVIPFLDGSGVRLE